MKMPALLQGPEYARFRIIAFSLLSQIFSFKKVDIHAENMKISKAHLYMFS